MSLAITKVVINCETLIDRESGEIKLAFWKAVIPVFTNTEIECDRWGSDTLSGLFNLVKEVLEEHGYKPQDIRTMPVSKFVPIEQIISV